MVKRKPRKVKDEGKTVMYIIHSKGGNYVNNKKQRDRTYVGMTNNILRRLRQHNGEIKGGARSTRGRKWKLACLTCGFNKRKTAAQFEWRMHHPRHRKPHRYAIIRRLKELNAMLFMNKVTKTSRETKSLTIKIYWNARYKRYLDKICESEKCGILKWPTNVIHKTINK